MELIGVPQASDLLRGWARLAGNILVPVFAPLGGATVSQTFSPAAAAYIANDIFEGAKEFASIGSAGDCIRITGAELEVDASALQSGETSYRLHLYSVTPPSALADNAAWDLPSGDRASYLGFIDLGSPVDLGSTCYVRNQYADLDIKLAGTGIFAYLVTNGAFTATAVARKVTLHTTPR